MGTYEHYIDLLTRAQVLVAHRHSLSAPSRANAAVLEALTEMRNLLDQNQIRSVDQAAPYLTSQQQAVLESGLLSLWAKVVTHKLFAALGDLVMTIDFIPDAIRFWKNLRRRQIRAIIQSGPYEWFQPVSERISISERIYSLQSTLDASLEKLGTLKELTARLQSMSLDVGNNERKRKLIKIGLKLLGEAYDSTNIVPPRKGVGAFQKLSSLGFCTIRFEPLPILDGEIGASIPEALDQLRKNLNHFFASRDQFASCFATAMAPCRVPSKIRQRWLHVTVIGLCVASCSMWILRNQREFHNALSKAQFAFSDFLKEHMVEPTQAIVAEVLLNQKPEIQDAAALNDTRESLRRMLADFVRDTNPQISSVELQRVIKDMDMSVVSLQYEKQLSSAVRNLMSGDIVRMLLIQVQFIKKELMVAMGAIDELMHANQLNLQMLATIPTFLVFGGVYTLAKELFDQVYKRTSESLYTDPVEIARCLRTLLRDIERLLNKQNGTSEICMSIRSTYEEDEIGSEVSHGMVLGVRDLGLLVLLLHQIRVVFESCRSLLAEEEQVRFDEDLTDLMEEGLVVSQQLAVIHRMYHSYPFLYRIKSSSSKWLLN